MVIGLCIRKKKKKTDYNYNSESSFRFSIFRKTHFAAVMIIAQACILISYIDEYITPNV